MGFKFPDEPTTPAQWRVIAWAGIVLLLVVGSVGFYFSFQAPPDKAQLAQQLRYYSLAFYGLAAAVYAVKRVVGFFVG
jgi:hypothetical protein